MKPSYKDLLDGVMTKGQLHESRIGETREILGVRVSMDVGEMVSRKGLFRPLGWIECIQLLGGYFDLDQIKEIAPNAHHHLFDESMAYGPRFYRSFESVVKQLGLAPDTRRALIHMCTFEDGFEETKPCTVLMQPFIRDRKLDLFVYMRSWDLIKGLSYDVMMYSAAAMGIAHSLYLNTGTLTVFAASGHIYAEDYEKVDVNTEFNKHFALADDVPREPEHLQNFMQSSGTEYVLARADGSKDLPEGFKVFDNAEE